MAEKETMDGRQGDGEEQGQIVRKGVGRQQRRKRARKQTTCGCVRDLGNGGCGRRSRRLDERDVRDWKRQRPERGHLRRKEPAVGFVLARNGHFRQAGPSSRVRSHEHIKGRYEEGVAIESDVIIVTKDHIQRDRERCPSSVCSDSGRLKQRRGEDVCLKDPTRKSSMPAESSEYIHIRFNISIERSMITGNSDIEQ